ncbi:MAG: alpha/beta fold hydrolase [Hyphomicrobium sp.]|nr:alpha/beta fold hydrolase [Hyphomicrobium sp.]MBN9276845.1 alpha/beta fold hydrolase [Hyphomicrobium sp.]OJU27790.1 MAG: alpha/beta hydrolase [Alphaproteobacteria bacterium 64-6]
MKRSVLSTLYAAAAALVLTSPTHAQEPTMSKTTAAPARIEAGHVEAGGIRYYYEIHGSGEPLLLLHGGLGSAGMFAPILPMLAEKRRVIGVDLHGHGRTELGNRPIELDAMGRDMATILDSLGIKQADVLGYSMGGGVGFQLALQHPHKVRRLVLASGLMARDGFYPEILAQQAHLGAEMAAMMKDTPMYQSYVAIAPKPEDFPRLVEAMGVLIKKPFDWSAEVPKLKMPVMLVYGDGDMFRPEHIVKFYQLLGGGLRDAGWQRETMPQNRLAILPNVTHYDLFMSPELPRTVLPFFDGYGKAQSWAEEVKGKN